MRGLLWAAGLVWAALVWVNAVPAHALNFDWVWRYFWPAVGRWTWLGIREALVRDAVALATVAAFDVAAWGAGRRMVAWLGGRGLPGVFGVGAAVAAGMAGLGASAAAAGLVGLAYPAVVIAIVVAAAGAAVAVPASAGTARGGPPLPKVPWPLAVLGAVCLAAGLLGTFAPEVSTDALRHWVEVPRRAFLLHRIVPPERWPLGWMPLQPLGENLCLAAAAGDIAVRLLSWQAWAFAAAAILAWGGTWGPIAAVAWLAGLNHVVLAQLGWTDMRAAACVLVAAFAQFGAGRTRVAGLAWGLAVATKPQAAVFLVAAVGAELLARRPRRGATVAAWALLPLLPWLVRNWLGAGSPVAPYGTGALPAFFLQQREWLRHESWSAILAAPFTAAAGASIWDALLSPVLVVVMPLMAVSGGLAPVLGLGVAGWAWTAGYAGRYLLPVIPVLLVGAALGAARLEIPRRARGAAVAVIGLALAWEGAVSIAFAFYVFNPAGVALGRETPPRYLERVLAPRPAMWRFGAVLRRRYVSPAAPCYVSGAGDAHYWPGVPVLEGEGMAPPLAVWAEESASPARLRVALRQRNLRWLVDEDTGAALIPGLHPAFAAWTPRARAVWRECLARWGRPVAVTGDATGRYVLWEIGARPHAPVALPSRLPATGY